MVYITELVRSRLDLILTKKLIVKEELELVLNSSIDTIVNSDIHPKKGERWINAIRKAYNIIIGHPENFHFNLENGLIRIVSPKSNNEYLYRDSCNCRASKLGVPCWHLCSIRLLFRYLESMKQTFKFPLSSGDIVIIDMEDFERVLVFKWSLYLDKKRINPNKYVRRTIWGKEKQQSVFLHRFLMNPTDKLQIDHQNNNGLDNRKANLRLATESQNHCNRKCTGVIPYKGVKFTTGKANPFQASITCKGVKYNLGVHSTAEKAAKAYDAKAKELHGEFAVLNFPEQSKLDTTSSPYLKDTEQHLESFGKGKPRF